MCASGKPEFEQSSLGVVLDNLPPPCKPDLDLVDVSLCPIYPIESESREDQSWTLNLRTPSTSSLTPRYHDVPPGTLLPPDGRSHWLHVMRMNEFCKDAWFTDCQRTGGQEAGTSVFFQRLFLAGSRVGSLCAFESI